MKGHDVPLGKPKRTIYGGIKHNIEEIARELVENKRIDRAR